MTLIQYRIIRGYWLRKAKLVSQASHRNAQRKLAALRKAFMPYLNEY